MRAQVGRQYVLERRGDRKAPSPVRAARRARKNRARRAHDALMLRTIMRLKGDVSAWAGIADQVDDVFVPPLTHGRYRPALSVSCMAGSL